MGTAIAIYHGNVSFTNTVVLPRLRDHGKLTEVSSEIATDGEPAQFRYIFRSISGQLYETGPPVGCS